MRVQLVVRAVIVAVSLCACSASAGPVSTVASVESSDGPTLFLPPSAPTPWALDEAFIDSLSTLTTTGHFEVLAAVSVSNRSVRTEMLGRVLGLCNTMRPPLDGGTFFAGQYLLMLKVCAEVRAMKAAVAARDDATFAESYANYLAQSAALNDLGVGTSSSDDSYGGNDDYVPDVPDYADVPDYPDDADDWGQ